MTIMVELGPVRRWIHQRQVSHRERGATLGNLYVAALVVAVFGAMTHRQLTRGFWPAHPDLGALPALALGLLGIGFLTMTLRAIGPVTLGRPAAYFLLTAPVSRRRLLLPSLRFAALGAAFAGALITFAITGHAAPHDRVPALILGGALIGIGLLLVAVVAQRVRRWATLTDRLAVLTVATGVALLVIDRVTAADRPASGGWPSAPALLAVAGALTVAVTAGFLVTVRLLPRTPDDRILEASKVTGTLFDTAFGMEPSFVTEMVARRYWANRRLRTTRPPARLPVLTGQDFLLARRRLPRLLWLLAATPIPLLLTAAPPWVAALALLLGAMIAGGTTTATVNTDAGNPVLLRLLSLSSRQALTQRLWVPGVLAFAWSLIALILMETTGHLPAGRWWLLSVPAGVIGGVAAVRRARAGFVRNDLLPLDTPMGTVSTGPVVYAVAGPDALILGIPIVIAFGRGTPLSLDLLLIQTALALLGARAYLAGTTDSARVDLQP
ncbi:hypothetical protein ACWT_7294 [Actinoplanes sp. SE50]|uniref:DUF6297 family protein n=1 Tax=unclassified Actinoplanes TaxID=2626549 RepID=UPI00023EDF8A|nr:MULTISPECIES: DUF6297 family protein [unclassified Actinoplanes]AEV88304.1 hypothetical protein ACPL_7424 [Actinoplanes sp. SE50/110]ATO86709.1 hypothetical protein ACWT_7294 [Actinoplanes sp. SE50]SLM04127.1 hypothetical protein ACSP50_7429 [Actinoplanes sp. SE50/110]